MKKFKKLFAWLLFLTVLVTGIPFSMQNVKAEGLGTVTVKVVNDTLSSEAGAPWTGTLFTQEVELSEGDSASLCVKKAVEQAGYTQTGADNNYITEIAELSNQGGAMSGWMATLNDWFTSSGLGDYTVADGSLRAGDEIVMLYTCAWGSDIGSSWGSSDKTLSSLTFSTGSLDQAFAGNVMEYELLLPQGTSTLQVRPSALVKNDKVEIYINEYDSSTLPYRKTDYIPVTENDTISIVVGGSNVYTVHLQYESVPTGEPVNNTQIYSAINAVINNYIEETQYAYGNEWNIVALARSEQVTVSQKQAYVDSVTNKLCNKKSNKIGDNATDNARTILALSALGVDAQRLDKYNLVSPLKDTTWVINQGLNGVCYALLALDSYPYECDSVKETYINYIIEKQFDDGGFNGWGTDADPDSISMVIEALTPYYASNTEVKDTIDKAIICLSNIQLSSGGYSSWGTENSDSTAQVVLALSGMKINALTDERFIKNGTSVLTALYQYYLPKGEFEYVISQGSSSFSTSDAIRALLSYVRMIEEKTNLYDMSDVYKVGKIEVSIPQEQIEQINKNEGINVIVDSATGQISNFKLNAAVSTGKEISLSSLFDDFINIKDVNGQEVADNSVVWKSSNEKVAIVETRQVTRRRSATEEYVLVTKGNGTATITASSGNVSTSFNIEVSGVPEKESVQQPETTVPSTNDTATDAQITAPVVTTTATTAENIKSSITPTTDVNEDDALTTASLDEESLVQSREVTPEDTTDGATEDTAIYGEKNTKAIVVTVVCGGIAALGGGFLFATRKKRGSK